jgi:hypothetical protein
MGFLFDSTEETYNAWVNNKRLRNATLGERHRCKCNLCPGVYENSLPRIEIHWDGVCYSCAVRCYPHKKWETWEGVLEMRQAHSDYWDALVKRCEERKGDE